MSLINFGGGLSSLGGAVAQTGGAMALEAQKAQLEGQKLVLAEQLAGDREHTGRMESADIAEKAQGRQFGHETEIEGTRQSGENARNTERIGGEMARTTAEIAGRHADEGMRQGGENTRNTERIGGEMARTTAEIAGRHADVQAHINAIPEKGRLADWYANADPVKRQAFTNMLLAEAGVPIRDDNVPITPSTSSKQGEVSPAIETPTRVGSALPEKKFNEAALQGYDAGTISNIKAMVDGTANPEDFNRKPALKNFYLTKAREYDPSFNEAKWKSRVQYQNSLAHGDEKNTRAAINQAMNHMDEFDEDAHALNNSTGIMALTNRPINALLNATDDPRINNLAVSSQAFSTEMGKVYKGTGTLGVHELDEWKDKFDKNKGPQTLASMAPHTIKMFDGRIDAILKNQTDNMGSTPMPPVLSPDAMEKYDRLSKGQGRFASSKTGWPTSGPPSDDIEALNKNPTLAPQFDKRYGEGAAKKYLGRWREDQPPATPPASGASEVKPWDMNWNK